MSDTIQFANGSQIINRYDATGMKYCTEYITPYTTLTTPVPVDSTCRWTFGVEDMDWRGKWYLGNRQYHFSKDLAAGADFMITSKYAINLKIGYDKIYGIYSAENMQMCNLSVGFKF